MLSKEESVLKVENEIRTSGAAFIRTSLTVNKAYRNRLHRTLWRNT